MSFVKNNSNEAVLIGLPLVILFVFRLLGFDGMVGQDSYAYHDFTKSMHDYLLNGDELMSFRWPKGYPLIGALISLSGVSVAWSLQLLSVISMAVMLLSVYKILIRIYPETNTSLLTVFLVLFGLLCPYYLRNSLLTMSDIFSSAMATWAIYCGLLYVDTRKLRYLLAFSTVCGLAVFSRYVTLLVLLPMIVYLAFWLLRGKLWKHVVAIVIPFLFVIIYFHFEGLGQSVLINHEALVNWDLLNFFKSSFETNQGQMTFLLPNLLFVVSPIFHLGFVALGGVFILVSIIRKELDHWLFKILLAGMLLFILFMAGIDTQNNRHLLVLVPFILIFSYAGFAWLMSVNFIDKWKRIIFVLMVFFQIALVTRSIETIYLRNKIEKTVYQYIVKNKIDNIYAFGIDISLSSRKPDLSLISLWEREHESFEKDAYVLFNEDRFAVQWEGQNPMLNWNKLKGEYSLKELKEFDNHWKLYRIE